MMVLVMTVDGMVSRTTRTPKAVLFLMQQTTTLMQQMMMEHVLFSYQTSLLFI